MSEAFAHLIEILEAANAAVERMRHHQEAGNAGEKWLKLRRDIEWAVGQALDEAIGLALVHDDVHPADRQHIQEALF